jgi:putative chitinase
MTNPDLVATEFAFESAMFFFDKNKLWDICDKGIDDATITALTKRINGGVNGLDHRKTLTVKYYNYIK